MLGSVSPLRDHTHTHTFSPHVHSPNDTVHSLKGVLGKTLRQTLETGLGPSGQGTQVPRYPKCGTERGSWALNEHIAVAPRFLCPLGRLWLEEGQSGTPNVQGPELGLLLPSARCEFISSTAHTEQQAQAHPRQCGGRSLWICSRSGSLSPSSQGLTGSSMNCSHSGPEPLWGGVQGRGEGEPGWRLRQR